MARPRPTDPGPNPGGFCMCGCGGRTPIAKKTHARFGMVLGMPQRYCHGHAGSKAAAENSNAYAVYMNGPLDTLCLIWQGAVNSRGYPSRGNPETGATEQVHVAALERRLGRPVLLGHLVHHRCETPRCINAQHLAEVTRSEHYALHPRRRKVAA